MEIRDLIKQAEQQGVYLYVEHGKLKFTSKRDGLSEQLRAQLGVSRDALIEYLLVEERDAARVVVGLSVIGPRDPLAKVPLSPSQQRLWFLQHYIGTSSVYNTQFALQLSGQLNRDALLQSLTDIVARHEVLRTHFEQLGDQVFQKVHDSVVSLPVEVVDDAASVRSACAREKEQTFDLAVDDFYRFRLLEKKSDGQHILVVTLHHSVSDGWSMEVFFRELDALYVAYQANKSSPLKPLEIQFQDFAVWQRDALVSDAMNEQMNYWRTQLRSLPALLNVPTDRPRPAEQSFCGRVEPLHFDTQLSKRIKTLSQKADTTVFMTLLAGFSVLLSRYSGQVDVAVGTPVANRTRAETEPLIGCFINTLVLRTNLRQSPSFTQLLAQVKNTAIEAFDHQEVPFEQLVEELNPVRSLDRSPFFQAMFAMQNMAADKLALGDLDVTMLGIGENANALSSDIAHFDLTLNMRDSKDGLRGGLEYNTDLFDAQTAKQLVRDFTQLMDALCIDPGSPVLDLNYLSNDQCESIGASINQASRAHWQRPELQTICAEAALNGKGKDQSVEIKLCDKHGQVVAPGIVGEISARSSGKNGEWQQYGIFARTRRDGELLFSSDDEGVARRCRLRDEVSLESLLEAHPKVRQAVVRTFDEDVLADTLVAYVTTDSIVTETAKLATKIRQHVRTQDTIYLLPAAVVILDDLPVDAFGEIDRASLTLPNELLLAKVEYVGPSSSLEKQLVEMWSSLLERKPIGINDDFFKIGGHSLLATRFISQVRDQLVIEMPLRTIFESPTIAKLAQRLESELFESVLPQINPVDRSLPLVLSYAQQRLWFINELGQGSVEYNVPGYFLLQETLDKSACEQAIAEILVRHAALRTIYSARGANVEQVILTEYELPIEYYDLSELDEPGRGAAAKKLLREEISTAFDIRRDVMLRIRAITLKPNQHLILFNMHHIASDGWSLAIFKNDFNVLYRDFRDGRAPSLAPQRIQYVDYANWEKQWLGPDRLAQQLTYWRDQLAGIPPVHALPLDKPRPAKQSFEGRAFRQTFDPEFSQRVKQACEREGVTLFMLLETAFAICLGRYSNEKDIVVGTAIAGRTHKDVEQLIGFFVNSLVLRTDLAGNPEFRDLLTANKQMILDAYAHQNVPFEMLVEELRPERDMSYNSLFQVLFVVQNNESEAEELRLEDILDGIQDNSEFFKLSIRFDLALHVAEEGDHLTIRWSFRDCLFENETITRIANNFQVLLDSILNALEDTNNEQHIEQLDLVDTNEYQTLVSDWVGKRVKYPTENQVHELFEQQVSRTPDAIAVIFDEQEFTYTELNAQATQMANYLIENGVGPGAIVGLSVERSIVAMVGLLGILKSGAAYLPLDPEYPVNRLNYMLDDSQVTLVLTQSSHRSQALELRNNVVCLDDLDVKEAMAKQRYDAVVGITQVPSPDDLAYIIYTSGSSGKPKGVMVNHRSVCNFLFCARDLFLNEDVKGSIVSSPLAFDATVQSLFVPLIVGKYVELLPEDDFLIGKLADYLIDDEEALLFKITPTHLKALGEQSVFGQNPDSRHVIVVAGEKLDVDTLRPWYEERLPGAQFINEYGPTEATVGSCTFALADTLDFCTAGAGVPIGKPLSNVQFYVLDSHLSLQPIGVAGELYIGGAGLAREYLNQPSMTSERFIPHPYSEEEGARLYRTGDQVRWLPDGNIEFLGRIDDQIKMRGFRIELGEIEAAILGHDNVKSAVVTLNANEGNESQLIAYVCPSAQFLDATAHAFNTDHVEQWMAINDDKYEEAIEVDEGLENNFFGWNSSYTGESIALEQMHEWLEGTLDSIDNLKPKRMLEMGCGQGLLLLRYAADCEFVHAMDISNVVLEGLQHELDRREWSHVKLQPGDALNVSGLVGQTFDTIVVNSVVQYFPNQLYFDQVIEELLKLLEPGGQILFGDVRNLDLIDANAAAVEKYQLTQTSSVGILTSRVQRRVQQEPEMLVSPAFFAELNARYSAIESISMEVKRGIGDNELLRYRYDVVIRKSGKTIKNDVRDVQWSDFVSEELLDKLICEPPAECFGVSGVPNYRIADDLHLAEGLSKWESARLIYHTTKPGALSSNAQCQVQSFEELYQKAESHGFKVGVTWSTESNELLDVIFSRNEYVPTRARKAYRQEYLINYPQLESVGYELSVVMKEVLGESLPDFMVPSIFIAMEHLPVTPSGKVDRKALPKPQEGDLQKETYVAPLTPSQTVLCDLWQELLKIKQVGVNDDFFALGGHSLLAVRLATDIKRRFDKPMSLKQLFDTPTILGIADYLDATEEKQGDALPMAIIDRSSWSEPFPLTGIQQAYLFGRSGDFELGNIATHSYAETTLEKLDVTRFGHAWNLLIQRHGMLRAIFDTNTMTQRILSDVPEYQLSFADLSSLDPAAREEQLLAIRDEMSHQVLSHDKWPLFDIRVSQVNDSDFRLHYSRDALISDAASQRILIRELFTFYDDPDCQLPELGLSFRDYLMTEEAIRELPVYATARQYWLDRLTDFPLAPQLPLAKQPREITHPHFTSRQFTLGPAAWLELQSRSQDLGVTPTVLVMSMFAQILARWSKDSRFTLNLTLFNRLPVHDKINRLVGDFTSLTLLEMSVNSDSTLGDTARLIQEQLWSDLEHRYFGGTEVLRALNAQAGAPQAVAMPIVFTSTLGLETKTSTKSEAIRPPSARKGKKGFSVSQTPQVWLDHGVIASEDGLTIKWMVLEELFPSGMLDEMFVAYESLLREVANTPDSLDTRYAELILRQNADLIPMPIGAIQPITVQHSADDRLQDLFVSQVSRQPDKTAIVTSGLRLSYSELDARAEYIAAQLTTRNVQPNQLVAVIMEKGWEQVVGVLGVLYAGAAYLPIDANLPTERIAQLVREGRSNTVVTQAHLTEQLDFLENVHTVTVEFDHQIDSVPAEQPVSRPRALATDLAYVIFTSGSTGTPKGVMIDHRGAVNTVLDVNERFSVTVDDRVLALSSLNFDLSVYDIFGVLAAGGTLVMPDAKLEKEPRHWCDLVQNERVTVWNTVPALCQLYVEHLETQMPSDWPTPELRLFMLSGDWIGLDLPERIKARHPEAHVISLGGATEASIWSILYPIEQIDPQWKSIPYGRAMANQSMHVLTDDLSTRPTWAVGQIHIGGIGLAKGYWQDLERSEERFVTHPISRAPLYRTGDLGRFLPDGNIEFLGRDDNQVKIHGHRIELGEIEAVLTQSSRVRECIVSVLGEGQGRYLAAYVVPNETTAESEAAHDGIATPHLSGLDKALFKLEQRGLLVASSKEADDVLLVSSPADAPLRLSLSPEITEPVIKSTTATPLEITFDDLSAWLACVRQLSVDPESHPLPKRHYPSAGSLYPIQLYLQIGAATVTGMSEGIFYYDPAVHSLRVMAQTDSDESIQQGQLTLWFVAETAAIEPVYGAMSGPFCELEAGHMSQLLAAAAPVQNLQLVKPQINSAVPFSIGETQRVVLKRSARAVQHSRVLKEQTLGHFERQSYRTFGDDTLDMASLTELLQKLGSVPATIIVHSRAQSDGPAAERFYVFDYQAGRMSAVDIDSTVDVALSFGANEAMSESAKLGVYVVAPRDNVTATTRVSVGAWGQQLMMSCTTLGIGVCPIGTLDVSELGRSLGLGDDLQCVYAFVGGAINDAQTREWPIEVSVENNSEDDVDHYKEFLADRLPYYMIPRQIRTLSHMPLTENGKIDRNALVESEQFDDAPLTHIAPSGFTQELLATLWEGVLKVDQVGAEDNFFALGGHSLLATQLTSRIRDAFDVDLSIRSVFELQSVGEQAQAIDVMRRQSSGAANVNIVRVSRDQPIALSHSQLRLWFLSLYLGPNAIYNVSLALRLRGKLNVDALCRCLETMVSRHEALRTRFETSDDGPVQVFDQDPLTIPIERVTSAQEVIDICLAERQYAFDLAADKLCRIRLLVDVSDSSHVLAVTIHHSVSDVWSQGVFFRELWALYRATIEGLDSPLKKLPIQFADYANWQRQWLTGERLDEQLAFWQERLAGLPPLLTLPTDRPRPTEQTYHGEKRPIQFAPEQSEVLTAFNREHGMTMFMTLLSAFSILLSRYAGQKQIAIGTPIANRTQRETENLIGFFANTLVMRSDLDADPSFIQLLEQTREMALEGYGHQDVPFEQLVEVLNPERNMSHSPVFQVWFVLQNLPFDSTVLENVDLTTISFNDDVSHFDLTLNLRETATGIRGSVEYNTDLFEAKTIDRLISHYQNLLTLVCQKPELPASQFTFLSDEETDAQLKHWNDTETKPDKSLIHCLIEQQAESKPDSTAVIFDEQELTFASLNRRADQIAHYLKEQGVGPEHTVALLLSPSVNLVAAVLAVLKTGAAYVPLDSTQPPARLSFMIEDSAARLVLTDLTNEHMLPEISRPICCLDGSAFTQLFATAASDEDPEFTSSVGDASRLAYIIYTSGSTGLPKGVMVTHENVANYLDHARTYLGEEVAGALVTTRLSFDATVTSFLLPLCSGRYVELIEDDEAQFERLSDYLADDSECLLFKLTPTHLNALLDVEGACTGSEAAHILVVGGEQFSSASLAEWQARLPNATFVNEYGPTEATVGCCVFYSGPSYDAAPLTGGVPIGAPIRNAKMYVLDEHLNVQPQGVIGELYIAGAGLARGYLGLASRTAQQFVPNPFATKPGERLYSTGDLVRYTSDSVLEYVGRADSQVKVRGFRIELGEIETHLLSQPCVKEAVVVTRLDNSTDSQILVAYLALTQPELNGEQDTQKIAGQVKLDLSNVVPQYMVPSLIVVLDALPVTANGKIDRQSLPDPEEATSVVSQYAAPRTAQEASMSRIWKDILRRDQIGIHDNFFDIGGHSLLATRLISAMRAAFDVELPLRSLFEFPTIAKLSQEFLKASDAFVLPPVEVASRDSGLPLSYTQQRLWFIDQLGEGSAQYNMVGAFAVSGKFDRDAFERALQDLLNRHQVLRTRFSIVDDHPQQVIEEIVELPLSVTDLSMMSDEYKARTISSIAEEEANTPFDLRNDLMLRIRILELNDGVQLVMYATHHIASDGWSITILRNELSALYEGHRGGETTVFEPLHIQYADYAIWQREWLRGDVLVQQLAYWRERLAGIPPVHNIPLDKPRPARQTSSGRRFRHSLRPEVTTSLATVCREQNVTLFMLLQTTFSLLLGRFSNTTDVVVGSAVSGRTHEQLEDLIGFFVNALVLRTEFSDDPTFETLLQRNIRNILDAYAHQHTPFEMLVEELKPDRNLSYNPLYQIMFAVQKEEQYDIGDRPESKLSDNESAALAKIRRSLRTSTSTRFDLLVHVAERGDELSVNWLYNPALFEAKTIENLSSAFEQLIDSVIANLTNPAARTTTPVSALSMIGGTAHTQLIDKLTGPQTSGVKPVCLHELFEVQASKHSDQIAVAFGRESLTYAELSDQSNRLANYLLRQGIRPNDVIGLCTEHSLEMMVGLLAVLKTGAAYLPLDPTLPAGRLAYMLEDSGVAIVLTQEHLVSQLNAGNCRVLAIDDELLENVLEMMPGDKVASDERPVTANDLAYVIYTSGSTGQPKGVMVSHAAVVRYCNYALKSYYRHEALDGALVVTPFSVDMTIPSLYLPLLTGARVQLLGNDMVLQELARELGKTDANYLLRMTPSHAEGLLSLLPANSQLSNRHTFVLGGEVLHGATARALRQVFTAATISNHYGPTEAVVGCVLNHDLSAEQMAAPNIPIGQPMDDVRLYILDEEQNLCVEGGIGELVIGGPRLSDGYVNDQDLTDQKFVSDPLSQDPTARFYRTGDLARLLPSGELAFVGRADEQVTLRGFRIELGEIESALCDLADVREGAAVVRDLSESTRGIVAYVALNETLKGEDDLDLQQQKTQLIKRFRESLSAYLPGHMIPTVYMFLPSLPLTPGGKLNRKELPAPEEADLQLETFVAPRNETETTLCAMWADVLTIEQIGVNDNFFTLGGHSLLATQLISLIREHFVVEIPLRALFEYPTISELASIIDAKRLSQQPTVEEEEFFL